MQDLSSLPSAQRTSERTEPGVAIARYGRQERGDADQLTAQRQSKETQTSNISGDGQMAERLSSPMSPPPPPVPIGAPGTLMSRQEKDRRFWMAMRGELPATDLVREKY